MPLRLTGQQLAIMRLLWDRGELTVAEVQRSLPGREKPAYSTVATVLGRLEKRGLVRHRAEGRTYHFSPAVSEKSVVREVSIAFLAAARPRSSVTCLKMRNSLRENLKRSSISFDGTSKQCARIPLRNREHDEPPTFDPDSVDVPSDLLGLFNLDDCGGTDLPPPLDH